jgi:hypothetical protein
MQTLEAVTMDFGLFSLTSPDGKHRIAPGVWPDVALALVAPPEFRARLVVEIDEALEAHAEAAREASAERRRRMLDQSRHVARLEAFEREPATQVALDAKTALAAGWRVRADELEAQNPKKNRQAIKTLRANAKRVGDEIAVMLGAELRQIQEWGEARGPILRAEARGEIIHVREAETAEVATDEYGARIIEQTGPHRGEPALVYSRGTRAKKLVGIEHAYAAGYLRGHKGMPGAEALRQAGLDYGKAFVIVEEGIARADLEATGGGSDGRPKAPQARLIEAGNELAIMRKALTKRQRDVLDLVCGKEFRVREAAAKIGSEFPATNRALAHGLAIARDTLHRAHEEGRVGNASAGLAAVTAALRRVGA